MPQVTMPDGTVVNMPDELDPALGARLRAFHQAQSGPPPLDQQVPLPGGGFADATGNRLPDAQSLPFESAPQVNGDPIVDMWMHALPTIAKGAPETLMDMIGNTGVVLTGGLTAPFVAGDSEDEANFLRDFMDENLMRPQGESAKQLTEGLGEAFEPFGNIKQALGEGTLELTGSPALATLADMAPDLGLTLAGSGVPSAVEKTAVRAGAKPTPSVSPVVDDLRAGGIELRPSDIRAMHPDRNVKVPGEFREKFADHAELKKDQTLNNQATLTKRAADEIGAKDLSDKSLDAAEAPHVAVYEMAEQVAGGAKATPEFEAAYSEALKSAQLPKGEATSVTRVIGALRRRANKRTSSNDVKTEEMGFADREMADRLEEAFGAQLESVGEPQLLQQYRDARQALAKINDVRGATRAEQIDAAALRRMNERFGGNRLSGGLKFIADASEFAPNVTGHSVKTAARTGEEMATTKEGIISRLVKGAVRKVPGMDVGAKAFQERLGPVDPARSSYYGAPEFEATPPPQPRQGEIDLREVLGLESPPGAAPRLPARGPGGEQADVFGSAFEFTPPPGKAGAPARPARGPEGTQFDALGEAFEFTPPPGAVGIPEDAQLVLQEALGLGEPLNLKQPPGRIGKPPKRKQ